jgi:hypothetical protein
MLRFISGPFKVVFDAIRQRTKTEEKGRRVAQNRTDVDRL